VRHNATALRLLARFPVVVTGEGGEVKGVDWWKKGPGAKNLSKMFILILRIAKGELACEKDRLLDPAPGAERREALSLGRACVRLLERRHGVQIVWAAGYREHEGGERQVWLFLRPWSAKNTWWALTGDDLTAIWVLLTDWIGGDCIARKRKREREEYRDRSR